MTTQQRKIQTSVTNFIYCRNDYLFLHRHKNKWIDAGRLNGIGGRVEPGENYLQAAIRETREETGYIITEKDVQFCGVVKLEGGYKDDWVMCFFKIKVKNKNIPKGNHTEDGELIWLNKNQVLKSKYELVDDLNYCFQDIIKGKKIFFINAKLNNKEKIFKINISKIDN